MTVWTVYYYVICIANLVDNAWKKLRAQKQNLPENHQYNIRKPTLTYMGGFVIIVESITISELYSNFLFQDINKSIVVFSSNLFAIVYLKYIEKNVVVFILLKNSLPTVLYIILPTIRLGVTQHLVPRVIIYIPFIWPICLLYT